MPLESHGSVPLPSTYRGLEFVFADWTLREPFETYERHGIGAVDRFFERSDEKYGYERGVPEPIAAAIGQQLQAAGRLDEISELLAHYWDTIKPPAPFLERLANAFRERRDTDRAIDLYRRALEVDPNSASAQRALSELRADSD
jgi:hypothetical protein